MKTEEKLNEFKRLAVSEAENIRVKNLKHINIKIKEEASKGIKEAEALSKLKIDEEFHKSSQARNKELLEAKNLCKRKLIDLRKEYENNIFEHVERKLHEFTKTEQYVPYLISSIKKVLKGGMDIYFVKQDMMHTKIIKEELNINILESDEDFIGGFKAIMPNKNMVIDNSFKSRLLEERERFNAFKISN